MVSFACSHCGRQLQARDELLGKKVKCPCGQLVVVTQGSAAAVGRSPRTPIPVGIGEETTALPAAEEPQRGTNSGLDTRADAEATAQPAKELYDFLTPPQGTDELGRLGSYRVLKVLGAGGMGVVFLAEDPLLKRQVALKAMRPTLAVSESARARFMREAIATAAIKHDHIVTIYQVGEDRSIPFLAMEYLEGEALDTRLKREGALPVAEVVRIGREIAEGLAAAHERGLIHRDIKPANIWLEGQRRRVKILDFGLARAVAEDASLTQSGVIVGTPAYMAPEQARSEKVDHRCDLFSLGCVLYHLATGQMPFQGKDTMSLLMALAADTPPTPRKLRMEIPPHLSALIVRLLAKNADQRPATAQEIVETLRQIETGNPQPARPVAVAKPADLPPLVQPVRAAPSPREEIAPPRKRSSRGTCCLLTFVFLFVGFLGGGGGLFYLSFYLLGGVHPQGGVANVQSSVQDIAKMAEDLADWGRPPTEWTSLFNGQDLTGWEPVGGGKWSAADGILKADGTGVGWLASKRTFDDLELMLEYRLPPKGNSGVFFRAHKDAPVDGKDFLEVQLLDDASYPKFPANNRTGAVFNEVESKPVPKAPVGQWNKLRVLLRGRRIQVWVNEARVVNAQLLPRPDKSGHLGLQMFNTGVEFRNIRVRERE